jgi:hypothetical protein
MYCIKYIEIQCFRISHKIKHFQGKKNRSGILDIKELSNLSVFLLSLSKALRGSLTATKFSSNTDRDE